MEQIPIIKENALKREREIKARLSKKVREVQQAKYEHKMYVKTLIATDENMQKFFYDSKKAELKFKKQNPNKKIFKTYILNYADCSKFSNGIITKIKQIPIEKNAKKVQIGTKTIVRNVPSGIQTRFGVDLLKTESKKVPVYKTVYPDNIVSFAHNNEELWGLFRTFEL